MDLSGTNRPEAAAGGSQPTIWDESLYGRFTFAGDRRLFTQYRGIQVQMHKKRPEDPVQRCTKAGDQA